MDKRIDLRSAIGLVRNGDTVALGGMTLYRRPVVAALAIAAAQRRDLEIVCLTGGMETDLLIGAGCVRRLRSCYTGLEVVGFAPHFRRALEQRSLDLVEETEYTLSYAIQAAAMRVPFLPMRDGGAYAQLLGVRPDLQPFSCPVSGQQLIAVPALNVHVAIIHAPAADCHGNCNLQGQLALDPHLPAVADITIVTAEKIVSTEDLMAMRGGIQLPGVYVSHVVQAEGGSRPTSCYPETRLDMNALLDYSEAATQAGGAWDRWLQLATETYR